MNLRRSELILLIATLVLTCVSVLVLGFRPPEQENIIEITNTPRPSVLATPLVQDDPRIQTTRPPGFTPRPSISTKPTSTTSASLKPSMSLYPSQLEFTFESLNITAQCKPYTRAVSSIGYVRDTDIAFIGSVSTPSNKPNEIKVRVYDREYVETKDLTVVHTKNKTKYYDRNCKQIQFVQFRTGDMVIVYAPNKSNNGFEASYIQNLTIQ